MKTPFVKLNFPPIKLKAQRKAGSVAVWDLVRGGYIVLTPEEWVRQHMLHFLLYQMSIPSQRIVLEYLVRLNNQPQRADIVVLNPDCTAHILVECKAPEVSLSQATLDQAVRYNSVVGARYIILTNGLTHHIYSRGEECGEYIPIENFCDIEI